MLTCLSLTTYHLHLDHVIILLKGTKLTIYGIKSKLLCLAFQVLEATFPIFLPFSPPFLFFFWPCCKAYRTLVLWPRIKPMPWAVEAWSLNQCSPGKSYPSIFNLASLLPEILTNPYTSSSVCLETTLSPVSAFGCPSPTCVSTNGQAPLEHGADITTIIKLAFLDCFLATSVLSSWEPIY